MTSKDLYSIREWAPLTVIERIPARLQRGLGLFPVDLNITCVDAVPEFLALGSDVGVVFWYNRHTGEMQKLKSELASRITCVKIVNSVEYMVAAGNAAGQVSVFQIQKQLPPDLNLVAPCTRAKPIERYTIRDLHRSSVSCCEWSKNGMKLFSGDRLGIVVLTEFDYQMHLSKSVEILSESYEIVQLSLYQSYLLVSTLYRSIVCQRSNSTGQWHLTQVGKKDRKQLIDCGGTFLKRDTKRPLLICGRPGLRFWIADTEGNVEKTLLFREAVARSPTWEIPILNPKTNMTMSMSRANETNPNVTHDNGSTSTPSTPVVDSRNFRELYLYGEQDSSLLITHDESTLYILNLNALCVEAVARGFRKILDFCVCEKEIFVLEGERSLLRLAPTPEKPNKTAKIIFNPLMPPPVPVLGAATCGKVESPVEYEPDTQSGVVNAEECFELPPIETLNLNIPIELAVESPRAAQNRRLEIFNQISQMDFDQSILHSSGLLVNGRKKRKSRELKRNNTRSEGIVEIGQAAVHEDLLPRSANGNVATKPTAPNSLALTTKPTLMDASYCVASASSDNNTGPAPRTLQEAFTQHLPDLLSPNTLQRTIEEKAKTLAKELNLPEVSLAPITAEELRASQAAAAPPPPAPPPPTPAHDMAPMSGAETTNALVESLSHVYPHQPKVEDAGVQTTPRKKFYYQSESGDYSAGQPVDGLCSTLLASNVSIAAESEAAAAVTAATSCSAEEASATASTSQASALHFLPVQPLNEEITSFLLDFRRARDPLHKSPPSAESNTSSEWEFLDN